MADEITVNVTANVDDSQVQGLEDEISGIDGTDVDVGLSDDLETADELVNTLDGLSALAVGEKLSEWGSAGEDFAQGLNDLNIQVGQLATQTSIAEPELRSLMTNIANETFPIDEAMMYSKSLAQIGIDSGNLGKSATDLDKINDAFGLGARTTNSLGQELSVLGVDMNNVSSSFNALAYANANTVGGMENYYSFLRKYDSQFKELGFNVDQASVIIAGATKKFGGGRAALTGLNDALKESNGDTRALEQALGLQAGSLDNASELTGEYEGQLQSLADEEMEHKTITERLTNAWNKLAFQFGDVFSALGSAGGVFSGVIGFGNQLNGTLNLLGYKGLTPLISQLTGGAGLGSALSGVGSTLISLATGPVGIIIAALIALGIAVYEVGKYFGWWSDVGGMFDAIKTGVLSLWEAFTSNEYVVQVIDLIKQGLTDAWNALTGFVNFIMSSLTGASGEFDILSWAINTLQTTLNTVGPVVIWFISTMINNFRTAYAIAQVVFTGISTVVSTVFSIINAIVGAGRGVWNGIISVWDQAKSIMSGFGGAVSSGLSVAGAAWNSFKSTVMDVVQPILDKIKALQDAASAVGDFIFGGGAGGVESYSPTGYGGAGGTVFNITINGNIDSDARINQLKEDFARIVDGEVQENEVVVG